LNKSASLLYRLSSALFIDTSLSQQLESPSVTKVTSFDNSRTYALTIQCYHRRKV